MANITVTGTGKAYAPADTVEIRLTVESTEQAGAQAVEKTDKKVKELKGALNAKGFDAKELYTANFNVRAEYIDAVKDGRHTRELLGYKCSEQLTFRLPYSAERLSNALSVLCTDGELQLSFTASRFQDAEAAAFKDAYSEAHKKAEALAAASGHALGELVSLSDAETSHSPSLYLARSEAALLCAAPAEINPQEEKLTAAVTAVWELV